MKIRLVLLPLLLSACTTVPTTSSWNTIDDYLEHPLLFKLTRSDRTIYLVGSMHVEKPIPENLRTLIRASEVYISESDAIDSDDDVVTRAPGVVGDQALSKEAIASAESALEGRVSHEAILAMSPSQLAEQVKKDVTAWERVNEEMKRQQIQSSDDSIEKNYDVQLELVARTAAVKRVALETGNEPEALKCDDYSGVRYLEKRAYDQGLQKSPALWEKAKVQEDEWCLKQRNLAWMKIIAPLEARYHRLFIAVGIAHIAFGEDNLVNLLAKKGYNVERQ